MVCCPKLADMYRESAVCALPVDLVRQSDSVSCNGHGLSTSVGSILLASSAYVGNRHLRFGIPPTRPRPLERFREEVRSRAGSHIQNESDGDLAILTCELRTNRKAFQYKWMLPRCAHSSHSAWSTSRATAACFARTASNGVTVSRLMRE